MAIYAPGFGAGVSFFGSAAFSNLTFFSSFSRTLPAIKRTLASSMMLGLTSFSSATPLDLSVTWKSVD